jgi:hypothetical protein
MMKPVIKPPPTATASATKMAAAWKPPCVLAERPRPGLTPSAAAAAASVGARAGNTVAMDLPYASSPATAAEMAPAMPPAHGEGARGQLGRCCVWGATV